jgi:hypothetical protein
MAAEPRFPLCPTTTDIDLYAIPALCLCRIGLGCVIEAGVQTRASAGSTTLKEALAAIVEPAGWVAPRR